MQHWKFEYAIRTRKGICLFNKDSFVADEADPEELARSGVEEILRKFPELESGELVRCRYFRVR
ncbi:hypothetical protein [Streptomyces sp. NPDC001404]|uniref:hypothetical protein n=1 Tax=Streptomyces sp. NPDC001404 TaxID=3364571 RepID=UPI0036A1D691